MTERQRPVDGRTAPARPVSLARRLLPAAALGGASVVFVLALDRPPAVDDLITEPAPGSDSAALAGTPTTTTATPDPLGSRSTSPTTTPSSSSVPPTPTCTGATRTGPSIDTRFGPVQVAATIADDGTICSVDAVTWPDGDRRSRSINQTAIPTLEQRSETTQGAEINAVSGATFTSAAYIDSLQALLDG